MPEPVPETEKEAAPTAASERARGQGPPLTLLPGNRDIRAARPVMGRLAARDHARKLLRVASLLLLDFAGLFAGVFAALALEALAEGDFGPGAVAADTFDLVPLLFLITALLFAGAGLYGPRESRPGIARTITTLVRAALLAAVFALVTGNRDASPWLLFGGLAFTATAVCGLRYGYELATGRLLQSIGYRRRAVLVGTGEGIDSITEALGAASRTTYETVGYFSLEGAPRNSLRELGDVDDLPAWLDRNLVNEVIVANPDLPQEKAVRLIDECQVRGVRVRIAPSAVEVLTRWAEPVPGEGVPLLEVKRPSIGGLDFAIKRVFDFVLAAVVLVLLSPLLLAAALAVRLTSRGPVLHRSLRPGVGTQLFRCLKFRTMYSDAEQRQEEMEPLNEASGAIFKIRDDPRLTPIGRFLRRNSIDELPQLLNVLLGQMSLVGPRPLPLRDHARLEEWHRRRYSVLPGITGLWQVSGRSDLTFDDMVRLDFLYIERWSVLLDLTILLKTVPAVVRRRGAY